jgi:hypothetical protein
VSPHNSQPIFKIPFYWSLIALFPATYILLQNPDLLRALSTQTQVSKQQIPLPSYKKVTIAFGKLGLMHSGSALRLRTSKSHSVHASRFLSANANPQWKGPKAQKVNKKSPSKKKAGSVLFGRFRWKKWREREEFLLCVN